MTVDPTLTGPTGEPPVSGLRKQLVSTTPQLASHFRPFALSADLDARAVYEQVQWAAAAPIGQLNGQGPLPSTER